MGRPLRHIEPHTVVEVTARAIQSRKLLRPSSEVREVVLGVLGKALTMYPVQMHLFFFASNHLHFLLTTPDAKALAGFMCFVQGNIAREVGRILEWTEKFWGRRYRAIPVVDEQAQQDRMDYIFRQGCKEPLVGSPMDWPGATCVPALLQGTRPKGVWFDRTAEYRARRRGETPGRYDYATVYEIELVPLPCFAHLKPSEYKQVCRELVEQIEADGRAAIEEGGKPPLGPDKVLAQDPIARPKHSKRSPAPLCHASTREAARLYRQRYQDFVEAFRRASRRLRSGRSRPGFPPGCFPPGLRFIPYPADQMERQPLQAAA